MSYQLYTFVAQFIGKQCWVLCIMPEVEVEGKGADAGVKRRQV